MNQDRLKLFRRILTVALSVLILAVAAFTIYTFVHKSTESEPEQLEQLSPDQESDTVTFEGETEYGYEVCYDNGVCVVKSAAELAEGTNE